MDAARVARVKRRIFVWRISEAEERSFSSSSSSSSESESESESSPSEYLIEESGVEAMNSS